MRWRAAAAGGRPEPDLTPERLAAALEADPTAREALQRAAVARRRAEPPEEPGGATGHRSERRARADEALLAVDALLLAGELVADGPGRLRLPGFGPSTWRAIAVLRAGASGPEGAWAAAVAARPAADLGAAAPAALRGLRADPALARTAAHLLSVEAERQDARHALITAEGALAQTLARGNDAGARLVASDCEALRTAIATADAAADALWTEGLRRAAATPEAR